MKTSQKGVDLIKKYEGLELHVYKDPASADGKPYTCGYGTTESVLPKGTKLVLGAKITQAQAEQYLVDSLTLVFEPAVNKMLKVAITQDMFDALVSFAYNLGENALASSTLMRLINAGDFAGAQKQFLRWNRAGGRVMRGLTRRRLAEAVLFGGLSAKELIRQCLNGVDPEIK